MDNLNKIEQDFFDEKVSLICEYNPHSPLFIRLANIEIQNNNIDVAIEILNEGIKFYPLFAVAHILLGKAFSLKRKYNEALTAYKTGCQLIHSEKSYEFYKQELELFLNSSLKGKSKDSLLNINSSSPIEMDSQNELNDEEINVADNKEISSNISIDDNLFEIAERISKAKIEVDESINNKLDTTNQNSSDGTSFDMGELKEKLFASETLAKIYIAQGEFHEAIKTYLHLIEKNPLKKNYYQNKIDEMKRKYE
ncbi:MAG: hypothetical protein STSR0008_14870 [Ignavibacterium sp.]